ncbi:hypothetical protein PaecuDRAFT_4120 [Paenibacillus curdlanolyticus YK9]|uniref:DUF2007 domain-containing protein n=1 Tax=Paenibacillus curdlanolyticus YK9 TaxID=717606 RepID=E0IEM9_9BACL|nr:hypothetical protein [Paenibacillus curdlanolyticus]EFM09117.1 hypothetical protein PaecuDRAFT_4120 [Paenibacillus curdlanolyticus YK9]
MLWLWSALFVIVIAAIIATIASSSSRWTVILTEGGTRVDLVDRLYAYLKSQGVKTKLSGDANLRRLLVHKRDEDRARRLVQSFQAEV